MAGSSRTLRPVGVGLLQVQPLASQRHPRSHLGSPADEVGPRRSSRLGSVVRGWKHDSGQQGCCGSPEKRDPDEPADHALGRSRGGFGTKFHLVCDGGATPLGVAVSPGQSHESKYLEPLLQAVALRRHRFWPKQVVGDKGYSSARIRTWLRRRRVTPVIPLRSDEVLQKNPDFDTRSYRKRNVIERCVGWLKEFRRIATRHEKLALNYLGMIKLGMIERCFRIALSNRT